MSKHGEMFDGALSPCPFCGQRKPLQGMGFGEKGGVDVVYVRCITCGPSFGRLAKPSNVFEAAWMWLRGWRKMYYGIWWRKPHGKGAAR